MTSNRSTRETSERATRDDPRIERWERERAQGRNRFILRRGVGGWGIPVAIVAVIYKLVQEQGFVSSPELTPGLREAIAVSFVVFPLCGYIFGRWLWNEGEAWYEARTRDGGNRRASRR